MNRAPTSRMSFCVFCVPFDGVYPECNRRAQGMLCGRYSDFIFAFFALLSIKICAARAKFSMRQIPEGGFQPRPLYKSRFLFAFFALFAAKLFFVL